MTLNRQDFQPLLPWRADRTVTVLGALFAGFSVMVSTVVFFYPLEIETRESAVWLHVLTLMNRIGLYDHAQVAFVAMHKGPIDSLLKLAIATLFPFLESWQVIRFWVLLLPYLLFWVTWRMLRSCNPQRSWSLTLYWSGLGYLLLLICAKEFLLVGRPDATVTFLYIVLVYLSIAFIPKQRRWILFHGVLCGTVGMAVILANWRILPCVLAVLIFALWRYWQANRDLRQGIAFYLLSYGIAAIALWGLLFVYLFEANWVLYYKHIFGFHGPESGWGTSDSGRGSIPSFLISLFNPYADPSRLKGGPLLLAALVFGFMPNRIARKDVPWLLLLGTVFAANALPYYLNFNGGGAWYFIPFVILLWFYGLIHAARFGSPRLALLGIGIAAIAIANYRAIGLPTVHRLATMGQASAFQTMVRSLEANHTILSEDTFLFRTAYKGDVFDSGDEVSAVYPTGYYGETFTKTVKQYLARNRTQPPDYILTGFTESSELRDLIAQKYRLMATGPANFTANGGESLRLFEKKPGDRS
ncbi:hypothetical protein [Altericista sp. CCNU0014]|uniref:hypothetical protein n=1 Tax=Altericista sp. CCNU0014 TaxID=3082949 RepID=UPI00384CB8B1